MGIRTEDYYENIFLESAARTVSGNSEILDFPAENYDELRCQVNITAVSGTTPTLNITLEDSLDGGNWNTVITFTQATGITREVKDLTTPFARRLRLKWVIAGTTPSFTFNIWLIAKGRGR